MIDAVVEVAARRAGRAWTPAPRRQPPRGATVGAYAQRATGER